MIQDTAKHKMLPTPDTSHVPYTRVYEPAEDSFLLIDTLSSPAETAFLTARFGTNRSVAQPVPVLLLEVGPGSGVVLAFLTAHAATLMGTTQVLPLGVDANRFACHATRDTVAKAVALASAPTETAGFFLDAVQGDLATAVRPGVVDVLVFNPPYVPTAELPALLPETVTVDGHGRDVRTSQGAARAATFEEESRLLALAYAGGRDGMETTERLIEALPVILSVRGCAYVLLCAQNRPDDVKARITAFGPRWRVETVSRSGRTAGWEKLQVLRICREGEE